MKKLTLPLDKKTIRSLKAGEEVLLSGPVLTARDQAHRRLAEALKKGERLPVSLKGQVIYYCGPTGTPPGRVIGSCGPTTASRMDAFAPLLMKAGLVAMIGKGDRSADVVKAIRRHGAVYFLAYAGCGALISRFVTSKKTIAYRDLGPEAIYALSVRDMPLIVGIDARGRNIYGRSRGRR
jgi:fumarate hydratase subunit beta